MFVINALFIINSRIMETVEPSMKPSVSTPSKRRRFVSNESMSNTDSDLSGEDPPAAGIQLCSASAKEETADSFAPEAQPPARSSQRARDTALQCCQVCGDSAAGAPLAAAPSARVPFAGWFSVTRRSLPLCAGFSCGAFVCEACKVRAQRLFSFR